jgi:RecG-like helicase
MGTLTTRWRSGLQRWGSQESADARELRDTSAKAGCCAVADAGDRQRVTVQGTLRTVTLRPRGGVPALEAELYDGSGVLTLVWLGRRRIAGIEPGRSIRVLGRVGMQNHVLVMFNPRYELGPR